MALWANTCTAHSTSHPKIAFSERCNKIVYHKNTFGLELCVVRFYERISHIIPWNWSAIENVKLSSTQLSTHKIRQPAAEQITFRQLHCICSTSSPHIRTHTHTASAMERVYRVITEAMWNSKSWQIAMKRSPTEETCTVHGIGIGSSGQTNEKRVKIGNDEKLYKNCRRYN